ncbi:MAG: LysR family transcriptional regulator [Thiotrichales bacterium]|nr:LysR family transcriptional regulator [Thiotrichales bacterium]
MLNITFNQIRLFEAVARHKSFTKAAKELAISQPAVSSQFKKLAETLGDPLLEIVGRKIYLTPIGERTYHSFRTLLEEFDNLNTHLRLQHSELEGDLVIAGVSASKYFLPFLVAEFLKLHPKVRPQLSLLNKEAMLASLRTQQHPLVITGRIHAGLPVHFQPFMQQTLAVVAAANSRLSQHGKLSLHSLQRQAWILPPPETSIRQAVDRVFVEAGLSLTPFMELGSYALIKQSIMAGLGIGVLSADAFRLEEHTGHLIRLEVEDFPVVQHWFCAYADKKQLDAVSLAFLDFIYRDPIETYLKNIYSPQP